LNPVFGKKLISSLLENNCQFVESYGAGNVNKKLALIPVVAILLVLASMLDLGLKGKYVFNSPYLLLILTFVFYWLVTPVVAYISAKGYLTTGSLTLLFVSLAFFVGVPFSIATGITAVSSPNETVTLGALGFLVSSAFQFLGAAQASFGSVQVGSEGRKRRLMIAFTGVSAISGLIILLDLLGRFPAFFVENSGVKLVDLVVYGFVILFFIVGGLLYLRLYFRAKTDILYTYSLALMLYGIGSFGITQQLVFGDAVVWVGRIATYIGLLYFLFALIGGRQENGS
jgi:hypothetical protein